MCSVSELRLIYSETTLKLQKYEKGNLENDHPTGCLDPYGHRHHPRRHQLHEGLKMHVSPEDAIEVIHGAVLARIPRRGYL